MTENEEIIEMTQEYGAKNYDPLKVVISEAEGVWVKDVDGNKYMDMLSAYSAVSHGHCHPEVVKVLKEQADRVTLTSRAFMNDQLGSFYKKVSDITGKDKVLPMNSGTEAVETAIKAARRWGYFEKGVPEGEAKIIVCENNFHGRSTTVISFSTREKYRKGYGPFTPGFEVVPFGDIEALEESIDENTVGFLMEPMQGEGGIVVPPTGYLTEAKELCEKKDVLFIADEIQTGLGRTGKMFACDWEDVDPDIYILGKALSAGVYPVSAIAADKEVMDVFDPGSHGSTFGGNPLGVAAAKRAIEVIEEEDFVENSLEMGRYMRKQLKKIDSPLIEDVRGRGLFIGVELKEKARPYSEALMEKGVLVKDTKGTVLRFAPPLIITKDQIDWALERVRKVLK
ncbi:MAG: ornithine--oxo-acid transaminase [Candidatus Thermoplasmatota archaeon]|nr:ornithine--oxo-acid transaminase [Candidatus Thermoplasmatota archaeon]